MFTMSVTLAHGSGGEKTQELLTRLILSKVPLDLARTEGGHGLDILDDGAIIKLSDGKYLVITVDSYTVSPPVFPGGDIGKLAACGTLNDLAAMGAEPLAVLDSIVVEEGVSIDFVEKITESMLRVLKEENVPVIGGDLKVMPRGQLDKILITMTGVGIAEKPIIDKELRPGDKIVVTGPIAEHGAAILAAQQGIDIEKFDLKSDCACLLRPMLRLCRKYRDAIHAARDPTRGGLATVLNEWARYGDYVILIEEEKIPIRPPVRKFCEMLGIDPLYLACEGVMVLAVSPEAADEVVQELHSMGFENASIIGEVRSTSRFSKIVVCKTATGGLRIVEPLKSSLVPRIC